MLWISSLTQSNTQRVMMEQCTKWRTLMRIKAIMVRSTLRLFLKILLTVKFQKLNCSIRRTYACRMTEGKSCQRHRSVTNVRLSVATNRILIKGNTITPNRRTQRPPSTKAAPAVFTQERRLRAPTPRTCNNNNRLRPRTSHQTSASSASTKPPTPTTKPSLPMPTQPPTPHPSP